MVILPPDVLGTEAEVFENIPRAPNTFQLPREHPLRELAPALPWKPTAAPQNRQDSDHASRGAAPTSHPGPLGKCQRLHGGQEFMLWFHLAKQQKFQKGGAKRSKSQSRKCLPGMSAAGSADGISWLASGRHRTGILHPPGSSRNFEDTPRWVGGAGTEKQNCFFFFFFNSFYFHMVR